VVAEGGAVTSMTGFARDSGTEAGHAWTWEARSVNGKQLDVRPRLANGFEKLEPEIRRAVGERFRRGNVSLTLSVQRTESAGRYRLNRELLDQVLAVSRELDDYGAARPRLDALLAVRGVIEPVEDLDEAAEQRLGAAVAASAARALDALAAARAEEGARLTVVLTGLLDRIETLVAEAAATAAAQPDALRARLRQQLDELTAALPAVSEDRLAQEAALLVAKADIREELDRLTAHIAQAREMLAAGGAIGRRLDFLCQEFNREANTLCSKSADVGLTRLGLDLKATIEQLREQVQNIE
jgi:uncharacterized protein (TIGR00255 family)